MFNPNIVKGRIGPSIIVVGIGEGISAARCGREKCIMGHGVKELETPGVGGGVSSGGIEPLADSSIKVTTPKNQIKGPLAETHSIHPLVDVCKTISVVWGSYRRGRWGNIYVNY